MATLTNTTRRVIAGLGLVVLLACAANYYLGLKAFGRFDKPALLLSVVSVYLLAHFLRPNVPMQRPTFSWSMFAAIAAIVLGISGWVAWQKHPGIGNLAFLALPGTVVIFLAYRWRLLRKELSDGTFSNERYHQDPAGYMMGPVRQQVLWLVAAVALVIVLVAALVVFGHLGA